jgi:hypothetical protein
MHCFWNRVWRSLRAIEIRLDAGVTSLADPSLTSVDLCLALPHTYNSVSRRYERLHIEHVSLW